MNINRSLIKANILPVLFAVVSIVLFYVFAYDLDRTDHDALLSLYTGLFVLFLAILRTWKDSIKFLTLSAFIFRAVLLLSIPNLSQDFYRFIWDGRMILEGWNPYLATPEFFISKGEFPVAQATELYKGMGELNGSHYTNYPPLNQLCFVIAGLFSGKSILGSVIGMRLIIIAADLGTLNFGKKLLKELKLPAHCIFWYILNPFIIIELTGNLHFEGVMIFFLIWSLYLLHINKRNLSAFMFACSVSVKLIPLIFLPLLIQKLGWKKSITYFSIVGLFTLLFFASFYSQEFLTNFTETVVLWFQNFEFNASLYYIAREVGYTFRGYNEIAIIGKIIPVIVILFVLLIAYFRTNKSTVQLISAMLLALSFYYFTATTVHPWYVATLLILSVFTKYRFPLVWSFVIILSYLAYGIGETQENLWVIGMEYIFVYGILIWEIFMKTPKIMNIEIDRKNG